MSDLVVSNSDAIMQRLEEQPTTHAQKHAEGQLDILKIVKYGAKYDVSPWQYGTSGTEVHPDSVWVIDVASLSHGWMGWEPGPDGGMAAEGTDPDEVFVPWYEPWPKKPEEFPWVREAYAFRAVCISSPVEAQVSDEVRLSDNKKLGQQTYGKLELAVRERFLTAKRNGNEQMLEAIYPKVQFSFEEVYLKNWKSTYHKPVVKILDFVSKSGVLLESMGIDEDPAPDADEKPKARAERRRD